MSNYLDLLEKSLSFSLWPQALRPIDTIASRHPAALLCKAIDRFTRKKGIRIAAEYRPGDWPALAHTMSTPERFENVRKLCDAVVRDNTPGSFVECGVWRGGLSIYARACLPLDRTVICCDSFEGLPYDPNEPQYAGFDALKVSVDEVRANFVAYDQLQNVEFVKGFFEDSLRHVKGPIAILRCDGDMFSSTMHILSQLHWFVSPGGYVIIDDWFLPPCRQAVENYRSANKINSPIIEVFDGFRTHPLAYWRKE